VFNTTMICVAAAIVFGILALFSAKYRLLAKEAWGCVFRKVTLRPCQSGLDRRVRMGATLAFSKRSPALGRAVYKVFPVLSFLLVALTIVSFAYLAWGGYNYALYGNCNGPGSTGFCVFDPGGPGVSEDAQCSEVPHTPEAIIIPTAEELRDFKELNPSGTRTVVFFGCYSCEYTREGAPAVLDLASERADIRFILVDFPLVQHANSTLAANAANCVYDEWPQLYTEYARALYDADLAAGLPEVSLDYDPRAVQSCALLDHPRVVSGRALGEKNGLYGTPTYIIGGKAYVSPLNKRALRSLVDRAPLDAQSE
jgi:protein-disulfide isomerase